VILDTSGLLAVADGDAALEPILRKAAEVAVPVVVLGAYRYAFIVRKRFSLWSPVSTTLRPQYPIDSPCWIEKSEGIYTVNLPD
jgi:hypothetical protein